MLAPDTNKPVFKNIFKKKNVPMIDIASVLICMYYPVLKVNIKRYVVKLASTCEVAPLQYCIRT